MKCKFIVKNVPHAVNAKWKTSTFLVVEPDEHPLPVIAALGAAYVDSDSMQLFMRSQLDSKFQIVLLVSLDGKYIVVRDREKADWGSSQEEWVSAPFEVVDSEHPWVGHLLAALKRAISMDPGLAVELGVKASDLPIPVRIQATRREAVNLERFEGGIEDAFRQPAKASTNELILAIVASNAKSFKRVPASAKLAMREEFERRTNPEYRHGEGFEHFYQIDNFTFKELRERQKRASANYKRLIEQYPNDLMDNSHTEVRQWLESNFDLDELLELCVFTWFSVEMPHAREKVLIMTTEECLRSPDRGARSY